MNSAISTNDQRPTTTSSGLQPWQFFVLAALGCATTIAYLSRGQGVVVVILGTVLMATAGIIGLAALRALRPLVSPEGDRTVMVGQRTRVALEREKLLTLRTIKELEFDRAMGKLSDADWHEMSNKLRARAAGLMRQLDAATGYRDQIEKDLAKRLGDPNARPKPRVPAPEPGRAAAADRVCESCATANDHDARFCKGCGAKLVAMLLCVLSLLWGRSAAYAQFAMPDAKQMSGIPRPVTDLPNGSVSIRLIRGDLSNNITNFPVELHAGSQVKTVKTDDTGRAQFDGLTAGTTVKALAVVDGERLESQEFPIPAQGGVRMMLVATDKTKGPATTPDAPPISGQVVIGSQSRIVIEPGDETVNVFYLLDIQNTARAPVNPPAPFVIDLPKGAGNAQIIDGSSPLATAKGKRVTVSGPFPPGATFVQVAYGMPSGSGSIDVTQTFPANIEQLAVVVKKVGNTTLSSRQVANQREMPAEGETYIAAMGGAIQAGQPIALTVSGFPHHSSMPRTIALVLTVVIVGIGAWAARGTGDDAAAAAAERKQLIARREKLFADLLRLEHDHVARRGDDRKYAARREQLIAALEQVYGALDRGDDVAA